MADMCGSSRHKTLRTSTGPPAGAQPSLFVFLEQLVPRNRLVRHLGELEQEVDHLVLEQRRAQGGERVGILAVIVPDLLLLPGKLRTCSTTAAVSCSSVTLILFFSPISAMTRPSRTRRSAMARYSSRAFSSVVPSSAKVRFCCLRSFSICDQTLLNSCSTRLGGGSNLWRSSS
jgi:hypothetical protein